MLPKQVKKTITAQANAAKTGGVVPIGRLSAIALAGAAPSKRDNL